MPVYYRASFGRYQIPLMSPRIAIVLKGYPRLSETFIAQEIRALELRGFALCIISLRHPYDPATHPIHAEIEAPVLYLPEYLHNQPGRVWRAWRQVRKLPGYRSALRCFVYDLRRDPSLNRIRRFGQALVMAAEAPAGVDHYYTHFMHTPSSVTYYASQISGKPWSISAHAKDIYTVPEWELREKLDSSQWLVTCTRANHAFLRRLVGNEDKVSLAYHGLDFKRFGKNPRPHSQRDGADAKDPVIILSVGRAVDKKGYDVLLQALDELPPELHWRFEHIGGGELLDQLRRQADELGLSKRIEWLGALPQADVLARYRSADLFVLPSKISSDGDRDGLPNVLMEAQSQGLACLSTHISGIPELIEHGRTGWLVEQKNSAELAQALGELITRPALRQRLGAAGCRHVRQAFAMERGIDLIAERLGQTLEQVRRSA